MRVLSLVAIIVAMVIVLLLAVSAFKGGPAGGGASTSPYQSDINAAKALIAHQSTTP